LETAHPIEKGSGKAGLKKRGWEFPINVECTPNPQKREFLLHPRLILYLVGEDEILDRLEAGFLSPAWSYILGRSQDLATVLSVERIDLVESPDAAFSGTLLPFEWRPFVLSGMTVLLPAAIDYAKSRQARQQRYLQVTWPAMGIFAGSKDTIHRDALPDKFWVDSTERVIIGNHKLMSGLVFFPVQAR
jgi:hypothetical protein